MHIFRVYFSKLATRNPIWRLFVGLLHSSIFIFLIAVLASQKILQDDIAVPLIIFFPIFVILTYTFFLRRFFNPEDLDKFLKSKEEKRKEREQRKKEREAEAERYKRELIKEEEKEKKRIKDNYLDIGLGHELPKTIKKIRRKITDKKTIKVNLNYSFGADGMHKMDFVRYYAEKYMPNLLHEIRKEVIDDLKEHKLKYPKWEKFIKKYDKKILIKSFFIPSYASNLVHDIMLEKILGYFKRNGWTVSNKKNKREEMDLIIVPGLTETIVDEIFYLHPPEK